MRHAVLGVGGIGGLIGGGLARTGADVVVLLRPETLERHPGRLRVESVVLGDFEAEVTLAPELRAGVDVLWVTVKAPQLRQHGRAAVHLHAGIRTYPILFRDTVLIRGDEARAPADVDARQERRDPLDRLKRRVARLKRGCNSAPVETSGESYRFGRRQVRMRTCK